MQGFVRDRVPTVTAVLSILSLALVFGAALRVFPETLLPVASDAALATIPHLNAAISTVGIISILLGVSFARHGEYVRHRAAMATSLALFAGFLVLYLYKVTIQGPAPFTGPAAVETYLYLPILAIHIVLAVVCLPLLYYVFLLAATRPIKDVFGTRHRRVGRVAAALWLVSFVLGNVVYVLLYVVY